MRRNVLLSVSLLGFFPPLSSAQMDIPPGVVRVNQIQGDVSVQRGDTGDWAAAALNQPLVGGDRLSTGDRSQAELQLDHANILRLGNHAEARIAVVDQAQIQVQIAQGLAYYTVFKDSEAEVEIDTPNAAIRPASRDSAFRIEVQGFETHVTVRLGAVDISTPQGSTRAEIGQAVTVRGTADEAGNVLGGASATDSWDSWNNDRDGLIRNAQSWNHTNRYFVGSEDLDAYGRWVNVPDYGLVWAPNVAPNWAPYRAGRWVWESNWGWTWVSQEPWGWTPYHYGRWFLYGASWMWWPGPVDYGSYRPEWAPAYVSFFGFGGQQRDSAGFGFASVGWLPIGPGDHFYPWYGRHGAQFNVVKITDATNSTNIDRGLGGIVPLHRGDRYSNMRLAATHVRILRAVSVLRADLFGTGRSASAAASQEAFRNGRLMIGNLPIVPTKDSLSATNRPAGPSTMMRGQRQRFFTKKQPAAAPASLDDQVARIREGMKGSGELIPAREVAQLDSADTPPPMQSYDAIERTPLPTSTVPRERRSPSMSGRGVRSAQSARTSRSEPASARRTTTLVPVSRGASTRSPSRMNRGTHTPSSRTPGSISTPTRRMTTLASGSRGTAARAAQSYISSAARQMDQGNYRAAIASYKQALQADRNSTAVRSRLERARRAMLAENQIIADRR